MNKREPEESTSFGRFLEISPAMIQKVFKLYDEADVESGLDPRELYTSAPTQIDLGIASNKIWDKKYKLRIKSKQTGRMFDINFKFTYEVQDNTPPEVPSLEDARCFQRASPEQVKVIHGYVETPSFQDRNLIQGSSVTGVLNSAQSYVTSKDFNSPIIRK